MTPAVTPNRGIQKMQKNTAIVIFLIFYKFSVFFYWFFRARNLLGARGVIFPKYEPVASHGDLFQIRNDLNFSNLYVSDHVFRAPGSGWRHLGGLGSKKLNTSQL